MGFCSAFVSLLVHVSLCGIHIVAAPAVSYTSAVAAADTPTPSTQAPLAHSHTPFGVAEIFFNLWGSVLLPSSHAASRPSSCLVIVCLILYAGYPSVFLPLSCCHRNASNNNSTIKCGRGQRLPATTAHLPKTPNHLFIALPSMFMPLTTKEIKLPTLKFNCIFLPEPHSKFLKATVVVESGKVRGMTTT